MGEQTYQLANRPYRYNEVSTHRNCVFMLGGEMNTFAYEYLSHFATKR